MPTNPEYAKGYRAAKRALKKEIEHHTILVNERKERVYMKCLELVLEHCNEWRINNKKVNNAEGYCHLAKVFADNSVSKMDES